MRKKDRERLRMLARDFRRMQANKRHPISFKEAMKMMRSRDGWTSEEGFQELRQHAKEYLPLLIAAYYDEDNARRQLWIIELIGYARSPDALPFLVEHLHSGDTGIRDWAIRGLQRLNTKEARTILWQAGIDKDATC